MASSKLVLYYRNQHRFRDHALSLHSAHIVRSAMLVELAILVGFAIRVVLIPSSAPGLGISGASRLLFSLTSLLCVLLLNIGVRKEPNFASAFGLFIGFGTGLIIMAEQSDNIRTVN